MKQLRIRDYGIILYMKCQKLYYQVTEVVHNTVEINQDISSLQKQKGNERIRKKHIGVVWTKTAKQN